MVGVSCNKYIKAQLLRSKIACLYVAETLTKIIDPLVDKNELNFLQKI